MEKISLKKIAKTRVDEDVYEALKIISIKKKKSIESILRGFIKCYVLDNLEHVIQKESE